MKKILLLSLAILVYVSGITQQVMPQSQLTKQHYMQKSRNKAKTGLILLGGGTACIIAGVIAYQKGPGGLILMGVGLLAGASSLPFFVSSGINRKKANRIAFDFKFEKSNYLMKTGFADVNYPGLSLKVWLK